MRGRQGVRHRRHAQRPARAATPVSRRARRRPRRRDDRGLRAQDERRREHVCHAHKRNQAPFSTEDRARWYEWGEDAEADFVEKIVPQIGLDIRKNPEKERCSWAIDLFDYTNNRPADLKVQNTPFFTVAKYRYCGKRCDPAYSVTLNRKDFENYQANHPDCFIYFWVHWTQREYRDITVPELYGVWQAELSKLGERIQRGEAPLHAYQNRQTDDHNARDSYVFSLRDEEVFERLL